MQLWWIADKDEKTEDRDISQNLGDDRDIPQKKIVITR